MTTTTPSINNMTPETGREVRENGEIINTADIIINALDQSGGFKTVSEFQSAIHDGLAFSYYGNQVGLANNGVVMFLGRTTVNQVYFDGFTVDTSQAPFKVDFYEAPTITNVGTLQTTIRRNRINPTVSDMLVYATPTLSNNGLLLDTQLIVAVSQGSNKVAGSAQLEGGWIMKANTDYLIVMTNLSGVAVNYNVAMTWHEALYNV